MLIILVINIFIIILKLKIIINILFSINSGLIASFAITFLYFVHCNN
jgi:hypothetical protein